MQKLLKQILEQEGKDQRELARVLGISYEHFRDCIRDTSKADPTWIKAFVIGYEIGKRTRLAEVELNKELEG